MDEGQEDQVTPRYGFARPPEHVLRAPPGPTRWIAPPPAPPPVRARRNSPLAIIGVLVVVLGLVLGVALVARPHQVGGIAMPVPGPVRPKAPPQATTTTSQTPEPVVELETNPLLADGIHLAEVTCELPRMGRSEDELVAFYEAALGCLDTAWEPALRQAGEPFDQAELKVTAGDSGCGAAPAKDEATAFYCGWDEIIYMPRTRILEAIGLSEPAHLALLAHEYGHHVQLLSGMMEAEGLAAADLEQGSPEALELVRRGELQANCFAGLFLASAAGRGSITDEQAVAAVDEFRFGVASDTHGTVANQTRWADSGFEVGTTSACNTWAASDKEVR